VLKCCFRLLGAKNPKKAFVGFIRLIPWGPTYVYETDISAVSGTPGQMFRASGPYTSFNNA
jgi:hypothetical protein